MALMKSCSTCGKLIPFGQARCPDCEEKYAKRVEEKKREYQREANRKYNARRDPKYKRFYHSKEWKLLSAAVMQRDGYRCSRCGKRAGQPLEDGRSVMLEVDHIDPVQTESGWEKRYDMNNLQTLCTDCHNAKHDRFQKKGHRPPGVG